MFFLHYKLRETLNLLTLHTKRNSQFQCHHTSIGNRITLEWKKKKTSWHINTIEDKEVSPNTFSGPHFHRLLSVLLSKYNCQFTTKKNLTIHMIFCICSIIRVYILHKPKATRLPASWSNEALEKQNIYKIKCG